MLSIDTFKLSQSLSGHDQDVKSVKAIDSDTIVSCSRDATVRIWKKDHGWDNIINHQSELNKFINCLTLVSHNGEKYIASGGNDKIVSVTLVLDQLAEPSYMLVGHEANVCSLDSANDLIISGSWDKTAKVWQDFNLKYNLTGHAGSVWDVKIIGEDTFLTCGADGKIILWQGDKKIKVYTGHQDVVRSLLLLPDGENFVSCSNDGTLKFWNIASGECLQTLTGHDSFVYSLALLSNGDVVSSAEDRTVRVWRDGRCIQIITFPCISVWFVSTLPNDDLVVGSSDAKVRIFTRSSDRAASEELQKEFKQAVEKSAINENGIDNLNKEKIPGPEALENAGKEGQTVMVKLPSGIIEAHQWGGDKWIKIGEVVGSSGKDKKEEYDGKFYDYVFDVDVKDGAPPLKLAFNVTDNPYVTAANFLERHELPQSYQEEIVRFILSNTQGVKLGDALAENPYADRNATTNHVLPQTIRLTFGKLIDFKIIEKVNSGEAKKFNDEQLMEIKSYFLEKNGVKLLEKWHYLNDNFNNKVFAYDFLRTIIRFLSPEQRQIFNKFLSNGLEDSNINIVNLTLKILCNISHEVIEPVRELLPKLLALTLNLKTNLSLATLLLNLSTYRIQKEDLLPKLASLIDAEVKTQDSEVAYRSLIAIGNLSILDQDLGCKKFLQDNEFKWESSRFSNLYSDFKNL